MSSAPWVRRSCADCPFRTDTPPGQFGADRYAELTCTVATGEGRDRRQPMPGDPWFACHKTPDGAERACAGWLAVCGHEHIGVRLAVARGRLDADALTPGDGWPALFADYAAMVAAQARP